MSKLIYCATPSRLSKPENITVIKNFVREMGYAPFHPFEAFPLNYFEANPKIGRNKSMEWCLRAVGMCDEFWMFGVSDGTLQEASRAILINKPIQLHFQSWHPGDPEWKRFYDDLGPKYGNPLDDLLKAA